MPSTEGNDTLNVNPGEFVYGLGGDDRFIWGVNAGRVSPRVVAMETCAGAHHWGRELTRQGHTVRLIPPIYVKPFVKRQKNDMADAEAICQAAQRPSMRFVPLKQEEQQASRVVFWARDLLVLSAPRRSTPCAVTWPSTAGSFPRACRTSIA